MPQQPNATTNKDAAIIAENEKWFNVWRLLPKIITIVFAVIFFLAAIIQRGWMTIVFLVIGAVFCALTYVILKLITSYKILHIYYLKKLSSSNANVASQPSAAAASEPDDVLPTI